jgi:hypothetical protein
MTDSHFLDRPINSHGKNSVMYLSRNPSGKAVVFIHGFSGDPQKTWGEFSNMISRYNKFEDCDFYFYGYDSQYIQTNNSATDFYNFLLVLNTSPETLQPFTLSGRGGIQYSKILIAAHSMGAIITRLSLMLASEEEAPWINKNEMILFAPAHNGSMLTELIREAGGIFPSFLKTLSLYYKYKAVTIPDLDEKSTLLKDLKLKTEKLLNDTKGKGDFTKAKSVIWAREENVVINARFFKDTLQFIAENTKHTTVCKPRHDFSLPIEKIIEHL